MFRLRTTTSLSVLALVVGLAGTAWLTTLTGDWAGPPGTSARVDKVRTVLRRHARPVAMRAVAPAPVVSSAGHESLPELTPVDMPPLPSSPWQRMTFASGRVVLQLAVDGTGHVDQATVTQSSGNTALDDRALRTVQRWRFAVPADHPQGLSGTVVMRYDDTPPSSL